MRLKHSLEALLIDVSSEAETIDFAAEGLGFALSVNRNCRIRVKYWRSVNLSERVQSLERITAKKNNIVCTLPKLCCRHIPTRNLAASALGILAAGLV
jgi:hypothetical protein